MVALMYIILFIFCFFINQQKINIRYEEQQNGGKHVAVNKGIDLALGELFFIVDSDDWLTEDSIETIILNWNLVQKLDNKVEFAGVSGNRLFPSGKVNGGEVGYTTLDSNVFDYRFIHRVKGDKAEVYLTSILKQYPFPFFEGEMFCPESVVWYRIGENYQLRFFNKGIYMGEYLTGGITDLSVPMRAKSPRYTALAYQEMANSVKMPLLGKVKSLINYWRFSPYNHYQNLNEKLNGLKPWWAILLFPIGFSMYLFEKKLVKRK